MERLLKFIEFNQYNLPVLLQILALYLLFMWLAVVVWTLRDITTRSRNLLVIVAITLFVAIGSVPALVIYLLIRPGETLEDNKNKDLFYASILDEKVSVCKNCHGLVRLSHKFCPHCSHSLEQLCPGCARKVNPTWNFCPHCQTTLGAASQFELKLFTNLGHHLQQMKAAIKRALGFRPKLSLPNKPNYRKFNLPKPKLRFPRVRLQLQLPKFPSLPRRQAKVKVIAAAKTKPSRNLTTEVKVAVASVTSAKKRGRGRPKGISDTKPRKQRADAGKKRGKYKH